MAKQTTYNKQKKKLTFMDIIKGNFLNRDEVKAHYKYFVFIFGLLMVMIYSNHLVNKKIEQVNKLKEETEEYKSRNAYAQSRLIKIRMESELGKEMVQDSLVSLESHPMKLLIKVDSTDDKATK
ncbi:FtsL-like putative cell division protein [Epilithonimonas sp.]|uniref:FtsL-like putative cell division protein n=1 Tax=Epilithonimonas sp. TaxID=2894511 RepID=UPI00289E8B0B|nr:FtsL-like putative cell division protein [Epilithonimonas sp.]